MIKRSCSGGVVFHGDSVFLLRNDKGEWVLPKGVIRERRKSEEVALERVRIEAGLEAAILAAAGSTSYEFYSQTRRQPVCNTILWYVMEAASPRYRICFEQGFTDGDWFPIDKAIERVTYSQDKSLVKVAYAMYEGLKGRETGA
ncbi:MAG: NUDIX domain-containing protein [Clostridia bacterium]|nr:NUDIX domain-containing protein [Clostridia bacterium]